MSASDSDNSIDWLASDDEDEDVESEPELDRSPARPSQTPPPPSPGSPRSYGAERKDGGGWGAGSGEDSGQGSPAPACCAAETWDGGRAPGAGAGLCLAGAGGRPERSKGRKAHKRPLSPVGTEHRERQPASNQGDKNRLFTAKCMELRCYIYPLSSILTGLRTGRYRERLSSFQESVAMDRIQRIMGVLQNPCMGERYINIILKMEEMLKTWFPNIKPRDQHTVAQTEEPAPAKKAKLSASGVAPPGSAVCQFTVSSMPSAAAGAKPPRVTDPAPPPGAYPAGHAKRLHGSAHAGPLTAEQQAHQGAGFGATRPPPPPSFPRCRATAALTQDSAVSSSTDGRCAAGTDSAPGRPGPAKISAPCLERLLKSTESIIGHKGAPPPPPGGGVTGSGCS